MLLFFTLLYLPVQQTTRQQWANNGLKHIYRLIATLGSLCVWNHCHTWTCMDISRRRFIWGHKCKTQSCRALVCVSPVSSLFEQNILNNSPVHASCTVYTGNSISLTLHVSSRMNTSSECLLLWATLENGQLWNISQTNCHKLVKSSCMNIKTPSKTHMTQQSKSSFKGKWPPVATWRMKGAMVSLRRFHLLSA